MFHSVVCVWGNICDLICVYTRKMTDCQSRSCGFSQENFRGPFSPACFVPTGMLVYMHFEAARAAPLICLKRQGESTRLEENVANFLAN